VAPTDKAGPGRPKSGAMRRDVFLKIRLSRAELDVLEQYAADQKLSVSDFSRRRLGLSVTGYGEGRPRPKKVALPAPETVVSQPPEPALQPADTPAITLSQFLPWL
jgi:hypothetical protein